VVPLSLLTKTLNYGRNRTSKKYVDPSGTHEKKRQTEQLSTGESENPESKIVGCETRKKKKLTSWLIPKGRGGTCPAARNWGYKKGLIRGATSPVQLKEKKREAKKKYIEYSNAPTNSNPGLDAWGGGRRPNFRGQFELLNTSSRKRTRSS